MNSATHTKLFTLKTKVNMAEKNAAVSESKHRDGLLGFISDEGSVVGTCEDLEMDLKNASNLANCSKKNDENHHSQGAQVGDGEPQQYSSSDSGKIPMREQVDPMKSATGPNAASEPSPTTLQRATGFFSAPGAYHVRGMNQVSDMDEETTYVTTIENVTQATGSQEESLPPLDAFLVSASRCSGRPFNSETNPVTQIPCAVAEKDRSLQKKATGDKSRESFVTTKGALGGCFILLMLVILLLSVELPISRSTMHTGTSPVTSKLDEVQKKGVMRFAHDGYFISCFYPENGQMKGNIAEMVCCVIRVMTVVVLRHFSTPTTQYFLTFDFPI